MPFEDDVLQQARAKQIVDAAISPLRLDELPESIHGYKVNAVPFDTLDEMEPEPVEGKFFGEIALRGEAVTDSNVVLPGEAERDPDIFDTRSQRIRVLKLGPPREGEPWTFDENCEVVVPFHAGTIFKWFSRLNPPVEESLLILDRNEVITIFRKKKEK